MARPRLHEREELLDRAIEVLRARGAESTSLDEILEAIGIGRGSFYNDFSSKQDLVHRALERFGERIDEEPIRWLRGPARGRAALRTFFEHIDSFTRRRQTRICFFLGSVVETRGRDETIDRLARTGFARVRHELEQALRAGVERQELRDDLPIEGVAASLLALCIGIQVLGLARIEPTVTAAAIRGVLALLDPSTVHPERHTPRRDSPCGS